MVVVLKLLMIGDEAPAAAGCGGGDGSEDNGHISTISLLLGN